MQATSAGAIRRIIDRIPTYGRPSVFSRKRLCSLHMMSPSINGVVWEFDLRDITACDQLPTSDDRNHLLAITASMSDPGTTPPWPPAMRPGAIPSFFKPS